MPGCQRSIPILNILRSSVHYGETPDVGFPAASQAGCLLSMETAGNGSDETSRHEEVDHWPYHLPVTQWEMMSSIVSPDQDGSAPVLFGCVISCDNKYVPSSCHGFRKIPYQGSTCESKGPYRIYSMLTLCGGGNQSFQYSQGVATVLIHLPFASCSTDSVASTWLQNKLSSHE